MTRIITGSARGRKLKVPPGLDIRPTPGKVREAIFSILGPIEGARVLDLYCGVGGLGIEALSRGAASATFVDLSRKSLDVTRENLAHTRLAERARCFTRRLPEAIDASLGGPFDLIFSDPPYADDPALQLGQRLGAAGLAAPDATWIHEGPGAAARRGASYAFEPVGNGAAWQQVDCRRYGDTAIWIFRWRTAAPSPGSQGE